MIDRLFAIPDVHSAIRKTLLWSLIISFVSVLVTQTVYNVFFPDIMADHGDVLRDFSFILSLVIATPFVGLFAMFAKRMTAFNQQMAETARRDPLTGLLNRAAFEDAIHDRALTRQSGNSGDDALILIDIDHFKEINDTHGHAAGDHVLRMVAVSIAGNVFERDHVARIGGEEFAVLLLGAGATGAVDAAHRIRGALEDNKTYYEGTTIRVTASLGVALFPDQATYHAVFRRADLALYRAKRGGRNRCEFNGLPPMRRALENLAPQGGTEVA